MSTGHRRTKIVVVTGELDVGGAERDVVRNFPRLNRDEFEVAVVLFQNPGALAPELAAQGIRYVARLPEPSDASRETSVVGGSGAADSPAALSLAARARHVFRTARTLRVAYSVYRACSGSLYMSRVALWLARALKRESPDIVHFFLPHSYAYGMLAAALGGLRAKRVMSRLSLNFYADEQRRLAWLERNVLHRRVDIAIGNSRAITAELVEEGVDQARVRLLHNGVELAPFRRLPGDRHRARASLEIASDAFVMLAVGNLHTYKGHRDLIEACAAVADSLPADWRLLIAGRDQEGNHLLYEALIETLGLRSHISILGPRDDVPTLLHAADVFVQPSHHEGLPNAIIEAMAASLPVIGTAVGGIPEVVTAWSEGEREQPATGWIVDARNITALGSAIVEAGANVGRLREMGERAQQRAEVEFSLERSVRDYEAIYRELTAGGHASDPDGR